MGPGRIPPCDIDPEPGSRPGPVHHPGELMGGEQHLIDHQVRGSVATYIVEDILLRAPPRLADRPPDEGLPETLRPEDTLQLRQE